MGKCKYCGQPAGFLRWKHRECHQAYLAKEEEFRQCRRQMVQEIAAFVGGTNEYSFLEIRLGELECSVGLPEGERKGLLVQGWERAVQQALEDSVLEEKEEERLVLYRSRIDAESTHLRQLEAIGLAHTPVWTV